MHFEDACQEKILKINQLLEEFYNSPSISEVNKAMQYSLAAGGKRLRPLLLLAAVEAMGKDSEKFLPVACGLEMIHTYSLIHDDLPAMDNDDFRRGKPTNHKVFGEAMAILAGDALQAKAFEFILSQKDIEPTILLEVARDIAFYAGDNGMVGGQAIDLESENTSISPERLKAMHSAKTGALFKAAIVSGGKLAKANAEELKALERYAELYGLAFQITDDILDIKGDLASLGKPIGSDEKNNKSTYVSMYGLVAAEKLAKNTVDEAIESLAIFGERGKFLQTFVQNLLNRTN